MSTICLLWFSVLPFWRISAGRKQRTLLCVSRATRIRLLRLFTLWFEWKQRIWCAADTEEHKLLASNRYSPKWHYAEPEEMNGWIKLLFCFLCAEKVFSSLHNIQIEPLMADGLFWWCFLYFSRRRQCYLLDSQWTVTNLPVSSKIS